jgi:hypothetical protein
MIIYEIFFIIFVFLLFYQKTKVKCHFLKEKQWGIAYFYKKILS